MTKCNDKMQCHIQCLIATPNAIQSAMPRCNAKMQCQNAMPKCNAKMQCQKAMPNGMPNAMPKCNTYAMPICYTKIQFQMQCQNAMPRCLTSLNYAILKLVYCSK